MFMSRAQEPVSLITRVLSLIHSRTGRTLAITVLKPFYAGCRGLPCTARDCPQIRHWFVSDVPAAVPSIQESRWHTGPG